MRKTEKFWSYDGETYETHMTAQEARERCAQALAQMKCESTYDVWPVEVEEIMWGAISERAYEISDARDEFVEYALSTPESEDERRK